MLGVQGGPEGCDCPEAPRERGEGPGPFSLWDAAESRVLSGEPREVAAPAGWREDEVSVGSGAASREGKGPPSSPAPFGPGICQAVRTQREDADFEPLARCHFIPSHLPQPGP